ncbi:transcription factor IIIA-like [Zingiber officinale]|uniref:transcription factor IIIA-like n=1 Tax=Zingiber officinale TaxID=94328 RepID=UPI001C4B3766|nr:transcription factor IIIA-like [Zingiber officinale]
MAATDSHSSDDGTAKDCNEGIDMNKKPAYRDIRRYYCQFCGICRSKKTLMRLHVLEKHKDELEDVQSNEINNVTNLDGKVQHTCQECGASFHKPAHLKQHMLSHSSERPFQCSVDDCQASYRRKDHLNRHSLTHQGKLFTCPVSNCNRKFGFKANMSRHVREMHQEPSPSEVQEQFVCGEHHEEQSPCKDKQECVCDEPGCGKRFKYPSKLKKHKDSHVKLDHLEVVCCEPGCMKPFTNAECLKAHIRTAHQYVNCPICKTKQLKKNLKRHQRLHEANEVIERMQCHFEGCGCTFSNVSNLRQHLKVVHQNLHPFTCSFPECGKTFPYKHVRDNHEKSGVHCYVQGDFLEIDEQRISRPRGGRKRKCPSIQSFQRKRVVPLNQISILDDGCEYLSWLMESTT